MHFVLQCVMGFSFTMVLLDRLHFPTFVLESAPYHVVHSPCIESSCGNCLPDKVLDGQADCHMRVHFSMHTHTQKSTNVV